MGRLLDNLERDHPAYSLVASDDGISLVRRDGHDDDFNDLARDLIDNPSDEFVVLPTPDGPTGYERVFLIPLWPDKSVCADASRRPAGSNGLKSTLRSPPMGQSERRL